MSFISQYFGSAILFVNIVNFLSNDYIMSFLITPAVKFINSPVSTLLW